MLVQFSGNILNEHQILAIRLIKHSNYISQLFMNRSGRTEYYGSMENQLWSSQTDSGEG